VAHSTCTLDNCERPVLARGMCSTHYSRWHKRGGQVRPKAFISDTERRCPRCTQVKHPAEFYSNSASWCADCEKSNKRSEYVVTNLPLPACYCIECGVKFRPFRRTSYTCSTACGEMRRRRFQRIESGVTRALRKMVQVEVVDPAIVFDRDDWICQLCHSDIPRDAVWPDVMSASLDHIKPISLGGDHSYANCQASHFTCNASKGARYTP
jgi:hypothetical protein